MNLMSDKKKNTSTAELKQRFDEVTDYLREACDKIDALEKENHLLHEYVAWKGLESEFSRFQCEAHKEYMDGLPFPRLVM